MRNEISGCAVGERALVLLCSRVSFVRQQKLLDDARHLVASLVRGVVELKGKTEASDDSADQRIKSSWSDDSSPAAQWN